jgi:hypothetical protein
MERKKIALGVLSFLLLLLGLLQPFMAQAAAEEQVKVHVAGMV